MRRTNPGETENGASRCHSVHRLPAGTGQSVHSASRNKQARFEGQSDEVTPSDRRTAAIRRVNGLRPTFPALTAPGPANPRSEHGIRNCGTNLQSRPQTLLWPQLLTYGQLTADQVSIASSSSMKPEIIDRPLSQNFGSDASSPNGASSSR